MAEYTISGIRLQNGDLCTLKDSVARSYHEPISTKTYTDVIGTDNENRYAGFFYLKVTPTSFRDIWRVRTRVIATVPGSASNADLYKTESTFEVWGSLNTVSGYDCANKILSTNYRPIYYNSVFLASETGYNNGCSHWIGFNLLYSTNPINTSYKRQIIVELYDHNNCTVELQDSLITPDDIPNRAAHTNWYTSSNTSYSNYDACSQGIKQIGDSNSTSINLLYRQYGNYIADSAIGRYELLFHVTRDRLTALNNSNNDAGTTKAMLTNVAFNPFLPVYYYNTTTVLAADAAISASSLYFHGGVFDARYTFNCGSTLVANKDIFVVAQPVGDGTCKIVSPFWAQDLPSTSDGKWYIHIGRVYDTYRFQLYQEHPVYMHDGTKVVEVHNAKNIGDSATVNGHTVAKDVPSDAVFTDTVYTHPTTSGYKHIPTGGSTGQILKWSSDGTAQWADSSSGLPSGGSAHQVLRKNNTNTGEEWGGYAVPAGGSQGQVLTKQANSDGALKWDWMSTVPTTDGHVSGEQLEVNTGGVGGTYRWYTRYHVPTGGSSGQVLYKTSNSNGALGWKNVFAAPSGNGANNVLKMNASNTAMEWGGYPVPAGGSTGQVLKKTSSTNGAVEWGDPLTSPAQFHCFYGTYDYGGTVEMGWMQLAIVFEIYRINNDEPARYSISDPSGMDFSELLNAHRAGRPIVLMDSSLEEDPENTIFYTVCELVEGEEVNNEVSYILKARRTRSDGTVGEKHLSIFYETEEYYWYLAEDITPTDYVSRTLVISQSAYNTLVNNNTVDPHTLYCIKEAT